MEQGVALDYSKVVEWMRNCYSQGYQSKTFDI